MCIAYILQIVVRNVGLNMNGRCHGTQALIASFEVATGKVICPSVGPTRTEEDFAAQIRATVETDPQGQWVFICDQLNTRRPQIRNSG